MPNKWCFRVNPVLAIDKAIPKGGTVPPANTQRSTIPGGQLSVATEVATAVATRLVKIHRDWGGKKKSEKGQYFDRHTTIRRSYVKRN